MFLWRRLVLALLAAALVWGQDQPAPDPASCRRYLSGPDQVPTECPDDLLFDVVSLSCLSPAEATCATDTDGSQDTNVTVVRKCCPEHQHFNLTAGACEDRSNAWELPFYAREPFKPTAPQRLAAPPPYRLLEKKLTCDLVVLNTDASQPDALFLLDDGSLFVQAYRQLFSTAAYCLETMVTADGEPGGRLGAAVCLEPGHPGVQQLKDERLTVPRCCFRRVPYDPELGCREDAPLPGDEPPPPLDLADPAVRAALADGIDVHYRSAVVGQPDCNGSNVSMLVMGDRPFFVAGDGALVVRNAGVSVPADRFCVNERFMGTEDGAGSAAAAVALVCADAEVRAALAQPAAPDCPAGGCVRKCCAPGFETVVVDGADGASQMLCASSRRRLELEQLAVVAPELRDAPIVYGQPACPEGLFEVTTGNFSVLADGTFREVVYDEYACENKAEVDTDPTAYCLDTKRGSNQSAHAFYCYKVIKGDDSSAAYVFFPILMGITDFFLLVTFIVYLTVPDPTQTGLNKKRKLSQSVLGMILLAYISSLFFAYLVLMIVQTANGFLTQHRLMCKILAVILYFFLLSAFFWLSVICFEIHRSTCSDKRTSGRKRFRLYAVYAWCCPLLMASLALIMDLAPGIDNCTVIKPAFGRYRCLFQNRKAFIAYFYIPIGVLLAVCLLLYVLTVKNLSVPRKMPGKDDSTTMSKQSAKQTSKRRRLCAKLFLIMGMTWMAELLSYLIGDSVVWYFFDVINILQGFFIFVAFILRPKVLQYIKKTALQSLSRSFGHDSQHDGGGHQRAAAAGVGPSPSVRTGQATSSPMTMSTRTTSTRACPPAEP